MSRASTPPADAASSASAVVKTALSSNRARPAWRRRVYPAVWTAHRWLGLGFAVVIVLVSLTGGLLVMQDEVERVFERGRQVVVVPADTSARAPLADIVRRAAREAPPGFRPLRLEPAAAPDRSDKLVFIGEDRVARWSVFVNPYTGDFLWRGPDQSLLRPWLLHLHDKLHLGDTGYVIVGLAAVALTLLGLTGVWMTRRKVLAVLRHPLRRGRGARLAFSDLHQWFGLVSIYFTLVLGLTGVWFAWLIVPGIFQRETRAPLAEPFDLAQLAPVEPALAAVRARFPGAELARIIFPWDDGVGLQIRVLHRDAPLWRKLSRMEFDPVTGEPRKTVDARDASAGQKFQSILGPLHFGHMGSPLVKWLYVVGGFAPALLAFTGTAIWWVRRARRPKPVEPRM